MAPGATIATNRPYRHRRFYRIPKGDSSPDRDPWRALAWTIADAGTPDVHVRDTLRGWSPDRGKITAVTTAEYGSMPFYLAMRAIAIRGLLLCKVTTCQPTGS